MLQTLYNFLREDKGYTIAETEETIIRLDNGMELPKKVKEDIHEYTHMFLERWSGFFPDDNT